jgi:hypothetical protein
MAPGGFNYLRLLVPDPYDCILSKLELSGECVGFVRQNFQIARDATRVAHVGKTRRVLGGSEKQFLLCAEFSGLFVARALEAILADFQRPNLRFQRRPWGGDNANAEVCLQFGLLRGIHRGSVPAIRKAKYSFFDWHYIQFDFLDQPAAEGRASTRIFPKPRARRRSEKA